MVSCFSCVRLLRPHGLQPTRLLCPWDSPGKNTGVGCHALLQGISQTWGLNSCLPASPPLQADALPTESPGKPEERLSHFNKQCWENWILTCRRIKLDPSLTSVTKINLKWNKDSNVRPETLKFLEESKGENLLDGGLAIIFLDIISKGQATKGKINKWRYIYRNYIKPKTCAQQMKQSTKWRGSLQNGRKYLQTIRQIKKNILIFKIH